MLGCENAVEFYRTSAVEYLFNDTTSVSLASLLFHLLNRILGLSKYHPFLGAPPVIPSNGIDEQSGTVVRSSGTRPGLKPPD